MKRFLGIYVGTMSGEKMKAWREMDEKTKATKEKAGMMSWMAWGEKNSGSILDQGAPLGKTKRVDASGVSDVKNEMTGYVLIEAESHEEAAQKFLQHPHFAIFPGEAVEVMEVLPMPGM